MEAAINDGEPTAQAAQRLRASELLPAAHVIRSIALMDLFVLALFYTMYFMGSMLLSPWRVLFCLIVFRRKASAKTTLTRSTARPARILEPN